MDGGTPASQTFNLPQGTSSKGKPFWSGDTAKGFKYSDSKGATTSTTTTTLYGSPSRAFLTQAVDLLD